jgi:PAS domain S-box-containing protein
MAIKKIHLNKKEIAKRDDFYLKGLAEVSDSAQYILYSHYTKQNYFSSKFESFFGFNPYRCRLPMEEKKGCVLVGSLANYETGLKKIFKNKGGSIKYQAQNAKTQKVHWLQEDIVIKKDPITKDVVIIGNIRDISSDEFYKTYISESEKRFKAITDAMPVIVWVADEKGKITYANEKMHELISGPIEKITRLQCIRQLVHPNYLKTVTSLWKEASKKRILYTAEFLTTDIDGRSYYLSEMAVPRYSNDGTFLGYTGTCFDLTNEFEYKKELETQNKQFELIANYSNDITLLTSKNGTITYISPSVKKLTGYSADELIGTNVIDLLLPEDKDEAFEIFDDEEKNLYRIDEIEIIPKQGGSKWFKVVTQTIYKNNKLQPGYVLHLRDFTEERKAFMALQESEQKYRKLFQNMDLGMLEVDVEEYIVYSNRAFENITGYKFKEMIGQKASTLLLKSDKGKKVVAKQNSIRKKGKESVYELTIQHKNGQDINLIISGVPLYDIDGNFKGSVGIHWNVTELRKMEQKMIEDRINKEKELLETKLQSEETQRALIGKDLHDGLGQLLTYIGLQLKKIKVGKEIKAEQLDEVEKSVLDTLNQVRIISRTLTPPAIKDLGLRDSIKELIASYSIVEKPSFNLKIYPQEEDYNLSLDKKIVVYRILQELLSNSLKYAEASKISVSVLCTKKGLKLTFNDDGIGFNLQQAKKGVGLRSMQSRVEFYKGTLTIKTSPGKGCVTKAFIPFD